MNDRWHEFVEYERRITAPPHLEARVLSAVRPPREPHQRRMPPLLLPLFGGCCALALAVLWPAAPPSHGPLTARAWSSISALPEAVAAHRPGPRRATPPPPLDSLAAAHDEGAAVLVMFDVDPPLSGEPIQLVRLRVRRDALQVLGLAVLEPDAGGTVDLDVLIGEDGLPREIRAIRNSQEER